jgi:predicted nucleic acid-binding protein
MGEEQAARELAARRADKDWSLCNAISFSVMEQRRIRAAFSFDHHFRQVGGVNGLGLQGGSGR